MCLYQACWLLRCLTLCWSLRRLWQSVRGRPYCRCIASGSDSRSVSFRRCGRTQQRCVCRSGPGFGCGARLQGTLPFLIPCFFRQFVLHMVLASTTGTFRRNEVVLCRSPSIVFIAQSFESQHLRAINEKRLLFAQLSFLPLSFYSPLSVPLEIVDRASEVDRIFYLRAYRTT